MIEGALRTERVFMGDSILRKTDRTLSKGEDVVVCLPGARIEHVTERVENVFGAWPRGVYISTRRDEQCRQGWNNQDGKEIQRVGRDTEEDES